jgi:hypothetical protein
MPQQDDRKESVDDAIARIRDANRDFLTPLDVGKEVITRSCIHMSEYLGKHTVLSVWDGEHGVFPCIPDYRRFTTYGTDGVPNLHMPVSMIDTERTRQLWAASASPEERARLLDEWGL